MMKPMMMDPSQLSKMMDQNPLLQGTPLLKQVSDLQQTAIHNSFNAMEIIQGRMEKLMQMFWDQTAWNSERMGSVFLDWSRNYQDGCEALQRVMEGQMGRLSCVMKPSVE